MPSDTAYAMDLYLKMTIHVGSCPLCGSLQPISCDYGKTLAYKWLTWSARHGSNVAQAILDTLREENWDPERVMTRIRREGRRP